MLHTGLKKLIGRSNANTFLGFAPGTLLVRDHAPGGGFAGAPQVLYIIPLPLGNGADYGLEEFPEPRQSIEYRIGGKHSNSGVYSPEWFGGLRQARGVE